jgi:hypothetical protein
MVSFLQMRATFLLLLLEMILEVLLLQQKFLLILEGAMDLI